MLQVSGGGTSVPQIFVNGVHIGGADDLERLQLAGRLSDLLEEEEREPAWVDSLPEGAIERGNPHASHSPASGDGAGHAGAPVVGADARYAGSTPYGWAFWREVPPLNERPHMAACPQTGCTCAEGESHAGHAEASAHGLQRAMLALYDAHLRRDGAAFDHGAARRSREFTEYECRCAALAKGPMPRLESREDVLAFFANLYNALVVHAVIAFGPPSSTLQRLRFFASCSYTVAGRRYSLNDIEHGVLRGNKRPPGSVRPPFSGSDPRREFMMAEVDPRIHFVLNCGAQSCPPIKLLDPSNVDSALDLATRGFLSSDDGFSPNPATGTVTVSKIFHWYASDFGESPAEIVRWCLPFLADAKRASTERALAHDSFAIAYRHYDWTVNTA